MYNITDSVLTSKAPSYIGVGIHKVELLEPVLDKSKNGKTFFAYYYTNSTGQRLSKTEWEINLPDNYDSLPDEKKQRYEAVIDQQMKRILKVAKLFVPEEEFKDKNFNSFSEFCSFVKTKLEGKTKGIELRIKATYDKNGWVTTPSYTYDSTEWIERTDKVPDENSTIQMVDGRDTLIRPKQDNGYQRTKNPLLENSNTNASVTDIPATSKGEDLPF